MFDRQLGRFTVVDTAGTLHGQFSTTAGQVHHLARGPGRTILVATFIAQGTLLLQFDLAGNLLGHLSPDGAERGFEMELAGGAACTIPDGPVLFASPFAAELVALDSSLARIQWARYWRSDVREEVLSPGPGAPPALRSEVMGFECSDDLVLLVYFDRKLDRLHYDVFDPTGQPLARWNFDRESSDHFGIAAEAAGRLLLTFRNRPFPRVDLMAATAR